MKTLLIATLFVMAAVTIGFAQQTDVAPAKTGTVYGKEVKKSGTIAPKDVEKQLETAEKFTGKVEGKVTRVCTMKGCWLALENKGSDTPIIVRFKDYGFFVPQDIVGKTVVVEGYAKIKEKEDKDNPGKTIKDIAFTADGVLVVK